MNKYLAVSVVVFMLLSTTALAKNENDPLGKVWEEIKELKEQVQEQKVSTYVLTAERNFAPNGVVSTVELLCEPGDTAISGSLDGNIDNLDYIQTRGDSPVLDNNGNSIGWKFTARHGDGTEIPVQLYVTCLKS